MSTSITVSVKSPSVTLTISQGSSTLVITSNGQTIYDSKNPTTPPEIPQGSILGFSGTATDSSGNAYANTNFYFLIQGPVPSSGTPPAPVATVVKTDSSGNWSYTLDTSKLSVGAYDIGLNANPSGA